MPSVLAPDGTALTYQACEVPDPRGALLVLPGWADHAGRYEAVAARMQTASIAMYTLDLRGHGRSGGRRAHLTRFSQLLGDLQAFRRAVRQRTGAPQVLLGHDFGALVVLRYLETQPPDAPAGAVIESPLLGLASPLPVWKQVATSVCADLWPTAMFPFDRDADHWSRDPAVNAAYAQDGLVVNGFTAGAWRETQWAQRAIVADGQRIECPLLFLLGGEDRIADAHMARAFAERLPAPVDVRWHPEMYHDLLSDPQRERVLTDVLTFLRARGLG